MLEFVSRVNASLAIKTANKIQGIALIYQFLLPDYTHFSEFS